ncbi:MAG: hypothetical protein ACFFC7_15150 [Candidatus Hermodarchaeota archaeon]
MITHTKVNTRTRILAEEFLALEWNKIVSAGTEGLNKGEFTNRVIFLGVGSLLQLTDGYIRPFALTFQEKDSYFYILFSIPFFQQLNKSETADIISYILELAKIILEKKSSENFEEIEQQAIEHIKSKNSLLYSNLVNIENRAYELTQEFIKRGMRFIKPDWLFSNLDLSISPEIQRKLKSLVAAVANMGKLNVIENEQLKKIRFRLINGLIQGKKAEKTEISIVASLQGRAPVGDEQLAVILVSRLLFDETIGLSEEDLRNILLIEILWSFVESNQRPRTHMEREIQDLILPGKTENFRKRIAMILDMDYLNELQKTIQAIIKQRLSASSEQILRL